MAEVKIRTRSEMMQEIHELTLQSIILSEVEVENGEKTIAKLEAKREELVKHKETLKGKQAYEFDKNYMKIFDNQLEKTKYGVAVKKQELDNQKVSLEILEDMMRADAEKVPEGQPATKEEVGA